MAQLLITEAPTWYSLNRGELVTAVLAHAWRRTPAPGGVTPEALADVTPLLLRTGGAGLGWWSIRHSPLASTQTAHQLRQAYRLATLRADLDVRCLAAAVTVLRSAGAEPLLAKGWAVARLYPELGLRPWGDSDLCVRPEQYARAQVALREATTDVGTVDLHRGLERDSMGFATLDDRPLQELYDRSQLVPLGDVAVRLLGPEDHLRLLCLHMLGHGACRPLWLCDIAVALEAREPDFDWDLCLSGDARRTEWVLAALCLAHVLLGAEIAGTPVEARARPLPRWLIPTVLRQWEAGTRLNSRRPLAFALRHPSLLMEEIGQHWRSPIEATVELHAPFNEFPRLPFQLLAFLRRFPISPRRWTRALSNRSVAAS